MTVEPSSPPESPQHQLFWQFERLVTALNALCDRMVEDHQYAIWVAMRDEEVGRDPREKAVMLYQAMWYEDGQDGRDTLTCPGIIGASAATIDQARQLNAIKDEFKAAVLALKSLGQTGSRQAIKAFHARSLSVNTPMRQFGAARLNLKEAYRHVPVLPQMPLRIGFTWSQFGRVIQRMTLAQVREMLDSRCNTARVATDREVLAHTTDLAADEMLARVRPIRPHLRANITYPSADGTTFRKLIQASVPLLLPMSVHDPLPAYVGAPAEAPMQVRQQRRDARIENEPFLPSIRVHRYRPAYRHAPTGCHALRRRQERAQAKTQKAD